MLDSLVEYGYAGLFLASFLSATILPMGSEVVFVGLLSMNFDAWLCTIIATTGNWLGGMTNYYIGKMGKIEWIEKYLKTPESKVRKIQNFLEGKGAGMAFFCFLPAVGDIIAIALGYMRANVYIVNVSMLLGKFVRYVALMYGLHWIMG
ncbi:MAG: DedA family protein [Candidatus Symbiothrix sp.]|jgi:membrane protein YqaA with SNARE-associated domain|nr:DedA family protein [Candidatus Symbiothrix sp.]